MDKRQVKRWLLALWMLGVMAGLVLSALAATPEDELISVDFRGVPIEDALRAVFHDTPYSFTLEPGISGKVTLALNEVPFSRALRVILDGTRPKLTYRKEDSVYTITAARAETTPAVGPVAGTPAQEQQVCWIGLGGRYELQYLDCRDVAIWFEGSIVSGTPQIPIPMGGTTGAANSTSSGLGNGSLAGLFGSGNSLNSGSAGGNSRGTGDSGKK